MAEFDLELERAIGRLRERLQTSSDAENAWARTLRVARDFFGGVPVCLAVRDFGADQIEVSSGPELDAERAEWDADMLGAFLRLERVRTPRSHVLAIVRRRDRPWAVLAAQRSGGTFDRAEARALSRIARVLTEALLALDRARALEVRTRLDRKIVQQVGAKDLFYQILDGLRSLTAYDHSSALFKFDPHAGEFRLVAEQIALRKAKSEWIGWTLRLDGPELRLLEREAVYGLDLQDHRWSAWDQSKSSALAQALDFRRNGDRDNIPREATMLVAPLGSREGLLGVIKLAGCARGRFGPFEAELLGEFAPLAAIAIQNADRSERLYAKMLEREKQLEIANLARFVAHDVNHHLGVALPSVQQLLHELGTERVDPARWQDDLRRIESSLERAHRLFRGMLKTSRAPEARGSGPTHAGRALEILLEMLGGSLSRAGVTTELDVPSELPPVALRQGDFETLFFNLILNARDAMPAGGVLRLRARSLGANVEIAVEDSGVGMSRDVLERVLEAYFTTKPNGNGLGLTICRSIVWEAGGEMVLESELGRGTRARLKLPTAVGATPE